MKEWSVPSLAVLGRVLLASQPLLCGELQPWAASLDSLLRLDSGLRQAEARPEARTRLPGSRATPPARAASLRAGRLRLPGRSLRSRWGRRPRLRVPAAPELAAGE